MKKYCLISLLLSGILSSILVSNALGAHRPGAISITPGIAYLWPDNKQHLDNTTVPNVAVGYDISQKLSAQLLVGVFHSGKDNDDSSTHGMFYNLIGFYHFKGNKTLQPYVLAGVGVMKIDEPVGNNPDNTANLSIGAGIEHFIGPSLSVHADVRDVLTTTGGGKQDVLANLGISLFFFGKSVAKS